MNIEGISTSIWAKWLRGIARSRGIMIMFLIITILFLLHDNKIPIKKNVQ